jgi:predicted ATPase
VLARGARSPSMRYFLRAESFFNVAQHVDAHAGALEAHGGRPLHGMSHGESFLTLVLNRFYPDGLFLLDEPEAAMSPQGCLTLLRRIRELAIDGAQFVIATHSPLLLAYPEATIYALGDDGIEAVAYQGHRPLPAHARLPRGARAIPAAALQLNPAKPAPPTPFAPAPPRAAPRA